MDTYNDMTVRRFEDEVRAGAKPRPCEDYAAVSSDVRLCENCGHDHEFTYYELSPELAAQTGKKYLAVSEASGFDYVAEIPAGREPVSLPGGNA